LIADPGTLREERVRMRSWLVVLAFVCASCAARERAAWVPRVALHAQLVRHLDAPPQAAWDWRVDASLYLQTDASAALVEEEEPITAPAPAGGSACSHAALCAWEIAAREGAIVRIEREEP
jgi:hypothetical protein